MTTELQSPVDFWPGCWTTDDAAAVVALVKDRLPPGWMADFAVSSAGEPAATVLHEMDPEGWPVFTMLQHKSGIAFASIWPCGSQVVCMLDTIGTALGLIPGGVFEAAAGRHGAMDEQDSDTRH